MIFESFVIISNFPYFLQPLCKQPTTSSSTSLSTSATTGSVKRKRRGIENVEVKTKFAASKIRVYDNKDMYEMENKSPQQSCKLSILYFYFINLSTIDQYCKPTHFSIHQKHTSSQLLNIAINR